MTLTFEKKIAGIECLYEFNLLHHVGVVPKGRIRRAAAETAVHEGNDNTPSGPMGRGVKSLVSPDPASSLFSIFSVAIQNLWVKIFLS